MDVRKPDLYVVTSLLHTDALSILTGEVCGRAGTQLQMDAENIKKLFNLLLLVEKSNLFVCPRLHVLFSTFQE